MDSLTNENNQRAGNVPAYIGFASNVSPEAKCSNTGVSPSYASEVRRPVSVRDLNKSWFLMRVAYGQEEKAKKILETHAIEVFLPTVNRVYVVNGKKRVRQCSLVPNMLFVYSTEMALRNFIGRPPTEYLHHYYVPNKDSAGKNIGRNGRKPLVIPDDQMDAFRKWHEVDDEHKIFAQEEICSLKDGDRVAITDGKFKGINGVVCRMKGQLRVGVKIEGVGVIFTAYIPKAFLKSI